MQRLYKEFGRLLRASRTNKGLTQQDVADRVGLSRTSVTNIELGRQHVTLHMFYLFATALDSSPEDLLPDIKFASPNNDSLAAVLGEAQLDEATKGWINKIALIDTSLGRKK